MQMKYNSMLNEKDSDICQQSLVTHSMEGLGESGKIGCGVWGSVTGLGMSPSPAAIRFFLTTVTLKL